MPAAARRRETSSAENPQSTRMVVVWSVTAIALPAEPEPSTTMRSPECDVMRAVYTAPVTRKRKGGQLPAFSVPSPLRDRTESAGAALRRVFLPTEYSAVAH